MWSRGTVLLTRITRKWSEEELERARRQESLMIFSDFSYFDRGRGRELVCTMNENNHHLKSNRAIIEAAPMMVVLIKKALKCELNESDLRQAIQLMERIDEATRIELAEMNQAIEDMKKAGNQYFINPLKSEE